MDGEGVTGDLERRGVLLAGLLSELGARPSSPGLPLSARRPRRRTGYSLALFLALLPRLSLSRSLGNLNSNVDAGDQYGDRHVTNDKDSDNE